MHTLAYRWRDSVGRDTEIGGHVEATHFGDVQQLPVDHIDCKKIVTVWGFNAVKAKRNGDRDWPRAVRWNRVTYRAPRQLASPRRPRDAT